MPGPYTNVPEEPGAINASPAKTLRNRAVKVMRIRGVKAGSRRRRK